MADTTLLLGNTAVVQVLPVEDKNGVRTGDERVARKDLGNRTTTVRFPADVPFDERLTQVRQLWAYHSDADGPEWVESDDDALAEVVARSFTTDSHSCQVGRPKSWKEDE